MPDSSSQDILALNDLSCVLGSKQILKSITFRAASGERVGLVGPNGAGKSTLLRCAAGVLPSTGTVSLFGRPSRHFSRRSLARRMAYLPQTVEGLPPCRVEEFLSLSRYPFHGPFERLTSGERDLIEELLELTGLRPFREERLDTLSGGERQRVLLAGCFCQEPELLLLDEPVSFLDVLHQEQFFELLNLYAKKRPFTALLVGHDLNRLSLWADRIIALLHGEVIFDGLPEKFMESEVLQSCFNTEFSLVQHPIHKRSMVLPS